MLSEREKGKAREALKGLENEVIITISGKGGEAYENMEGFLGEISGLSDKVKIEKAPDGDIPGFSPAPGVRYHAVAAGKELTPFLEALEWISRGTTGLEAGMQDKLEGITHPIDITVFITPQCPFCARVVRSANRFALENENIRSTIIDLTLFPQLQETYHITSTPTVLLNDGLRLTGHTRQDELLGWLEKIGSREADLAQRLIQGEAEGVAREAVDDPEVAPILARLAFDVDFGLRIGAVVALEILVSRSREAVRGAVPFVLEKLKSPEKRDRGDAAYLLGLIGDEGVLKHLQPLLEDEDTFIRETAQEAMESIKERKNG